MYAKRDLLMNANRHLQGAGGCVLDPEQVLHIKMGLVQIERDAYSPIRDLLTHIFIQKRPTNTFIPEVPVISKETYIMPKETD